MKNSRITFEDHLTNRTTVVVVLLLRWFIASHNPVLYYSVYSQHQNLDHHIIGTTTSYITSSPTAGYYCQTELLLDKDQVRQTGCLLFVGLDGWEVL